MALAMLNQILEQLPSLDAEELQQLYQAVQQCLTVPTEVAKRPTFHEALIASGLVQKIKEKPPDQSTERCLIAVKGMPISTTIIEERR